MASCHIWEYDGPGTEKFTDEHSTYQMQLEPGGVKGMTGSEVKKINGIVKYEHQVGTDFWVICTTFILM